MSLILDALKKAETERNGNLDNPSIDPDHSVEETKVEASKRWQWLGVAIFLIGLLTLGYLILFKNTDASSPNSELPSTIAGPEQKTALTQALGPEPNLLDSPKHVAKNSPELIVKNSPERVSKNSPERSVQNSLEAKPKTSAEPSQQQNPAQQKEAITQQPVQEPVSNQSIASKAELQNKAENNVAVATDTLATAALQQTAAAKNSASDAEKKLIEAQYQAEPENDLQANTKFSVALGSEEDVSADIKKLYDDGNANAKSEAPKSQVPAASPQVNQARNSTSPAQTGINTESISAFTSVRLIKELPFSAQEAIPTMIYSEHDYRGKTGSSVVINGKNSSEGASLGSGVRIEQILEDGMLLKKGNYQFKMQALNSWLNY